MPTNNPYSRGGSLQPDPSINGVERMAVRQSVSSPLIPTEGSPTVSQQDGRPQKPEVRPRNKTLDELYRLKQLVNELQTENDRYQESVGQMAFDLDEAERSLDLKTRKVEEKEAELIQLRKSVGSLSAQLEHQKSNQVNTEARLQDQKTSTETQILDMQQRFAALSTKLEKQATRQNTEEVECLQTEVLRLNGLLNAKDEELKNKILTATDSETQLNTRLQAQTTALQEQIALREKAETNLLSQQQQTVDTTELAELRRMSKFYQDNSQRLSRQINAVDAENRLLHESDKKKTMEIDFLKGRQKAERHIPGQW